MGYKQRRSVSATLNLSGRSPDGERFGKTRNPVQEGRFYFFDILGAISVPPRRQICSALPPSRLPNICEIGRRPEGVPEAVTGPEVEWLKPGFKARVR